MGSGIGQQLEETLVLITVPVGVDMALFPRQNLECVTGVQDSVYPLTFFHLMTTNRQQCLKGILSKT
jgi:hypothetical protein